MTQLEWLKTPPKRHSPSTLSETLEKISFLKKLGVHQWIFDDIPQEKQRGYASTDAEPTSRENPGIERSQPHSRAGLFLRITLLELSDSALYQSGRRAADLVRHAYNKMQAKQAHSSVGYRERLVSIKGLVQDTEQSAEARLEKIAPLLDDLPDEPESSHAANVRQTLMEDSNRVRALLGSLDNLSLQGRIADPYLQNLSKLKEFYADKVTELPQDQVFTVDKVWSTLIDDPDRSKAFNALEVCTMLGLRKSLRRGSIWVDQAFPISNGILLPYGKLNAIDT